MVGDLSVKLFIFIIASLLVGLIIAGFLIDGLFVNLQRKWKRLKVKENIASRGKDAYKVSVNGYASRERDSRLLLYS